jgi:hypothetical protein
LTSCRPFTLPAISAIAAITTAAAPATTAATMTTASAATAAVATTSAAITATAAAASTATTTAALGLWPGFIHHEVSPAEVLTVQRIDRAIRIFVIGHFDEGKAARLSRKTIADQIDA